MSDAIQAIKVADLEGEELDYWVAKIEGLAMEFGRDGKFHGSIYMPEEDDWYHFSPSTIWHQGGEIIEREGLNLRVLSVHNRKIVSWACEKEWPMEQELGAVGPTPLIAAMRAFVISKFGDVIPGEANEQ